ncbi:MAG: hypothetical protein CMJ28_01715 [Phycisphaerae bacterium]|nr:hypothetical protein [Phycisphaerae bacterium]
MIRLGPAHADSLADAALEHLAHAHLAVIAESGRSRTRFGSALLRRLEGFESCRSIRVAPSRDQRPEAILMRLRHSLSRHTTSDHVTDHCRDQITERLAMGSEYNAIMQSIFCHLQDVDDCRWQVVLWPDAGLMAERWPDIFDQVIEVVQHAVRLREFRDDEPPTLHRWILLGGSSLEDRVENPLGPLRRNVGLPGLLLKLT